MSNLCCTRRFSRSFTTSFRIFDFFLLLFFKLVQTIAVTGRIWYLYSMLCCHPYQFFVSSAQFQPYRTNVHRQNLELLSSTAISIRNSHTKRRNIAGVLGTSLPHLRKTLPHFLRVSFPPAPVEPSCSRHQRAHAPCSSHRPARRCCTPQRARQFWAGGKTWIQGLLH